MKRFAVLSLLVCLLVPAAARAATVTDGGHYGIYIAPKFIYGIQQSDFSTRGVLSGINFKMVDHDMSKGVAGGAFALGYNFKYCYDVPVRLELEYSAFGNASKNGTTYPVSGDTTAVHMDGKTQIQSVFANVYYDFHNESQFTPYVGGGLGVGIISTKGSGSIVTPAGDVFNLDASSKSKADFAFNIGLGCAYDFSEYFSLDLGYRFAYFGDSQAELARSTFGAGSTRLHANNNRMHQFLLSARFTF